MDSLRELWRDIGDLIERVPHGPDAPMRLYEWLASTSPAVVVAVAAAAGLAALTTWRHKRAFAVSAVGVVFLSFLVLPSGREVVRRALELPVGERPACLVGALARGAVWQSERLPEVSECRLPEDSRVAETKDQVDDATDGVLAGLVENDRWQAVARVDAPAPGWQARSVDEAGNRDVYFENRRVAYRVSPCPAPAVLLPTDVTSDTTGHRYVNHFYRNADPAGFRAFVTEDTRRITIGGVPGVYRFTDQDGETTGFLVPASGQRGDCAVLTGPYRRQGGSYTLVARPTNPQLNQLREFAVGVKVADLRPTD